MGSKLSPSPPGQEEREGDEQQRQAYHAPLGRSLHIYDAGHLLLLVQLGDKPLLPYAFCIFHYLLDTSRMTARGAPRPKGYREERYRSLVELLVAERKRQGVSQDEMAARLRHHQPYVSRYETGERRLDAVEFIDVARALGLEPAELVRQVPPP